MELSVLKTVCYADVFDFPLESTEIYHYLIHPHSAPRSRVEETSRLLVQQGRLDQTIVNRRRFFHLPNRHRTAHLRINREKYSFHKLKKTRRVGELLKKIPWIQAVYLTGSLTMKNVKKNDDIDLMIITKAHKLWTSRLVTNLLLDSRNLRRKPHHQLPISIKDKVCTNLYLDETSLKLPISKRNLFTAHELVQAQLLWHRHQTHLKLRHQNSWTTSYLPHATLPQDNPKPQANPQTRPNSGFIENLAFTFQRLYMSPKITNEIVNSKAAFFHPQDVGKIILKKYHQRLQDNL